MLDWLLTHKCIRVWQQKWINPKALPQLGKELVCSRTRRDTSGRGSAPKEMQFCVSLELGLPLVSQKAEGVGSRSPAACAGADGAGMCSHQGLLPSLCPVLVL